MFLFFNINNGGSNFSKQKLNDIVEMYYSDISKYCRVHLNTDISYADDITNKTFELLCVKWNTLKDENYKSWLYETADNLLKNFYKTRKRKTEKETYIDDMADTLSYEQNFESIDEYTIEKYKDEILDSLSEQEGELFNMNYIEKLPHVQIREILFISEKTLEKRLYRLKQKIIIEVAEKIDQMEYK